MKSVISFKFLIVPAVVLSAAFPVYAFESYVMAPYTEAPHERFTNENWNVLPHPSIAEFTIDTDGNAYGRTVNGIYFSQYTIPNAYGLRIQRFEIEDHYHYVVEGEVMDSLEGLSAVLAQAYSAHGQAV